MTTDPHFEYFIEKFGEATHSLPVPNSILAQWKDKLPPRLLTLWSEEGWAGYANGLLWLVNPDDFEDIKDAWLEGTPLPCIDNFHVIARSAFGSLYLCGEKTGRSVTISCPHNEILALKKKLKPKPLQEQDFSIQSFFGSRDPEDFDFKDTKGKFLFDRAMKKYGPLEADEMYGFEPALVMGGDATLDNLQRVKLDPYLLILRQFDDPKLPFSKLDFDTLIK